MRVLKVFLNRVQLGDPKVPQLSVIAIEADTMLCLVCVVAGFCMFTVKVELYIIVFTCYNIEEPQIVVLPAQLRFVVLGRRCGARSILGVLINLNPKIVRF